MLLSLADNQLEGNIPHDIGSTLPNLKFISCTNNLFTGIIPTSFSNASELQVIGLSANYFNRTMLKDLGKLSGLIEISVYQNRLQDDLTFISSLTNCTSLQFLEVDQNKFTELSSSLGNLTSLITLNLGENNVPRSIPPSLDRNALTGSLPSEVGSLKNLGYMDVSYNKLSGSIPNTLKQLFESAMALLGGQFITWRDTSKFENVEGLKSVGSFAKQFVRENPKLYGEVPIQGVFQNGSAISIVGNNELCGGKIPSYLGKFQLDMLNLSFNRLYGEVPIQGVFQNGSAISIVGNNELCGELLKATNGFSKANLIGVGSYASVYKGILDQVQMVAAVKVLNLQTKGAFKSFMSECKALRAIRHRNLLKTLSVCSSVDFHGNEFKALVYEFMANGNLGNWLHQDEVGDHEQLEEPRNLTLIQKLDISMDIASALEYLHCGCESTIIHADLKPSNVLLDDEMTNHIGDFGLAKIISTVSSDVAQEYGMGDMASTLGNVYSFGILLLEMFTGKKPIDNMFKDHLNLHNFVKNALPDRVMETVNPCILLEHNTRRWIKDCMVSILQIGVACSMESPRDRMEMGSVISELHKIKNTYMNEGLNQD
ncbi:probable LRR receptor-like serine/threonine-protein kinase At3g47570 [Camellia sinensis]|uniref:probable LRR receptor-like serine/threonine-protein kinase At3g47570 n=1 Tax=Camellia sinensis TaxID=4442 RepID=UPI001035FF30|nr:probable LRR receptor-like serine/threonine-protein kinase At3g47570 [Camellia sinensis]